LYSCTHTACRQTVVGSFCSTPLFLSAQFVSSAVSSCCHLVLMQWTMNIQLPLYNKVQFESEWTVPGRGGADSSVSCLESSDSSCWGDISGCDDTGSILEKYGHIKVPRIQTPVAPADPTNSSRISECTVLMSASVNYVAIWPIYDVLYLFKGCFSIWYQNPLPKNIRQCFGNLMWLHAWVESRGRA
jgi:hypothetical protein